ncbi:hypothetical protein, partial [Bacillus paranthracis]
YGIHKRIWADRRFEDAESLKASGGGGSFTSEAGGGSVASSSNGCNRRLHLLSNRCKASCPC